MSNWVDTTGVDQAHPSPPQHPHPFVPAGSELWVCVSVSLQHDCTIVSWVKETKKKEEGAIMVTSDDQEKHCAQIRNEPYNTVTCLRITKLLFVITS